MCCSTSLKIAPPFAGHKDHLRVFSLWVTNLRDLRVICGSYSLAGVMFAGLRNPAGPSMSNPFPSFTSPKADPCREGLTLNSYKGKLVKGPAPIRLRGSGLLSSMAQRGRCRVFTRKGLKTLSLRKINIPSL